MAQDFVPQTRVKVIKTGKMGVVIPNTGGWLANSPAEVPVVIDGSKNFKAFLVSDLISLGPEGAICDEKCDRGRGIEACIFRVDLPDPLCQRYGPLRLDLTLRSRAVASKRAPTAPYPECKRKPTANA